MRASWSQSGRGQLKDGALAFDVRTVRKGTERSENALLENAVTDDSRSLGERKKTDRPARRYRTCNRRRGRRETILFSFPEAAVNAGFSYEHNLAGPREGADLIVIVLASLSFLRTGRSQPDQRRRANQFYLMRTIRVPACGPRRIGPWLG